MDNANERTVVFADLAGFTALTEAHGDVAAVDLVERFVELVRARLEPGDSLIKTIGDAVMLSFATPERAVVAVGAVAAACLAEPLFPAVRVGLHHGPVVERAGDLFGATVNVAARVAARAHAGQLLATARVAEAAARCGAAVQAVGVAHLRNLTVPIELFELLPGPRQADLPVDPVCRMRVVPASAAGHLRHGGADYWFCSLGCAGRFAAAPGLFVAVEPDHAAPGSGRSQPTPAAGLSPPVEE